MSPQFSPTSNPITDTHLIRKAVIYIRQSSAKQVRNNVDSQLNQRSLVERAKSLGWSPERIQVFDSDLGQSAAEPGCRNDFNALIAEVALGQVGIVFGWDASRLARNNADWYQLLDLATLFGTLIGDIDGIYEPRDYNARLLLGLKGTMSEAELYMLRQRLNAGRMSKVKRGEYVQPLPTGLVRLADQRVIKDSDAQVRQVLELVFAKFEELGSCPKVMRYCKAHDIRLPRYQHSGLQKGEILWKKPSDPAIREIISNPAYAGAFAYGRRQTDPTRKKPGRPSTGLVRKPIDEWQCLIHEVYPAYISWQQYLSNQARMKDNAVDYAERRGGGRGSPRSGAALLQGLATCGECGRKMRVAYKSQVRYQCDGLARDYAEPMCASLDGPSIETFVVNSFLEAIQPAQFNILEELLSHQQQEHHRLAQYHQQQIQRAEYEANLAGRRYQQVDPDNRLVAGTLEQQWEEALRALQETQEAAQTFSQNPHNLTIDPELREHFTNLSQHLPELWSSSAPLSHEHRKQLLRCLIDRVILKRLSPDRIQVKIVWVSGHFSEGTVIPPIHAQSQVTGYEDMVKRVEQLWRDGHSDPMIAQRLTQEGFRSARSKTVVKTTVRAIRLQHHWTSRLHEHRTLEKIDGMWTVSALAKKLGVGKNWLYERIRKGRLPKSDVIRRPPYNNYLIRDNTALIEQLSQEAKDSRTRRQLTNSQT